MVNFMQALKSEKEYESDDIVIKNIFLDDIKTSEQVREHFDDDKLSELADSIREHGIQNPIHVRLVGKNQYVVLTGERRFRASQNLKLDCIPCIVHEKELSENDIKALQLIENLQRQDLTAIETAKGFEALANNGLDPRAIARKLGISEATVSKGRTVLRRLKPEWLDYVQKSGTKISLNELYEVAKEKSKQKRAGQYQKLMKKYEQEIVVEIEEKAQKPKKNTSEFSDDDWNKVWEHLKKVSRGNRAVLAKYITPKRVKEILEIED